VLVVCPLSLKKLHSGKYLRDEANNVVAEQKNVAAKAKHIVGQVNNLGGSE
jgi:hypothetical protein